MKNERIMFDGWVESKIEEMWSDLPSHEIKNRLYLNWKIYHRDFNIEKFSNSNLVSLIEMLMEGAI